MNRNRKTRRGKDDGLVWDPLTERHWWGIQEMISLQLKIGFWNGGEELSLGMDADLVVFCVALPSEAVGVNPLSRALADKGECFSENELGNVMRAKQTD